MPRRSFVSSISAPASLRPSVEAHARCNLPSCAGSPRRFRRPATGRRRTRTRSARPPSVFDSRSRTERVKHGSPDHGRSASWIGTFAVRRHRMTSRTGLPIRVGSGSRNGPSRWLNGCLTLDDNGFVKTGPDLSSEELAIAKWPLARPPHLLETNRPRIFAVGEVRGGNIKRVASAVGEGSIAVAFVHQVLRE